MGSAERKVRVVGRGPLLILPADSKPVDNGRVDLRVE